MRKIAHLLLYGLLPLTGWGFNLDTYRPLRDNIACADFITEIPLPNDVERQVFTPKQILLKGQIPAGLSIDHQMVVSLLDRDYTYYSIHKNIQKKEVLFILWKGRKPSHWESFCNANDSFPDVVANTVFLIPATEAPAFRQWIAEWICLYGKDRAAQMTLLVNGLQSPSAAVRKDALFTLDDLKIRGEVVEMRCLANATDLWMNFTHQYIPNYGPTTKDLDLADLPMVSQHQLRAIARQQMVAGDFSLANFALALGETGVADHLMREISLQVKQLHGTAQAYRNYQKVMPSAGAGSNRRFPV